MEAEGKLMSHKEVQRLEVLRRLQHEGLSQSQAARQLGVSVRQVKRLVRRVRDHGPLGLVSGRRGQRSNRRIDDAQQAHYMELVRTHYVDFGPQLAREYLAREHGFGFSVETLRGWMIRAGPGCGRPSGAARSACTARAPGARAWASWCRSTAATTTGSRAARPSAA